MKKVFAILTLMLSLTLYGQEVKISDMIYLLDMDIDASDTWIVKQGFKLTSDENSKDENCIYFFAYVNKTIISNEIAFYKCKYNDYLPEIAFRTRSESDYLSYKEEYKTLGFDYKETIVLERGKLIIYTLTKGEKQYELSLATSIYEGFNVYEVAISVNKQ